MMTLKILENSKGRLVTDHGIFHLESQYYEDDIVISDETGEIFEIECSTTDENGDLCELEVE
ncbi:MAG: hypothetical protein LUG65_03265 [Clostridiales bacterium]|nr:hypothetical protein [Clostridiales bacterium]